MLESFEEGSVKTLKYYLIAVISLTTCYFLHLNLLLEHVDSGTHPPYVTESPKLTTLPPTIACSYTLHMFNFNWGEITLI